MINLLNYGHDFIRFFNSNDLIIEIFPNMARTKPLKGNDFVDKSKYPFVPYKNIISFLVVNDGIIVSFDPSEDASNEEKRRNVLKFNTDGLLLWIVEDKYKKIWSRRDAPLIKAKDTKLTNLEYTDLSNNEKHKKTPFNNLYLKETYPKFKLIDFKNNIISDETNGNYFSLNIETGEVEYLKTIKD